MKRQTKQKLITCISIGIAVIFLSTIVLSLII